MFSYYNFFQLDPRPQGKETNEKIFSKAQGGVFGVEVTIPVLADRCLLGNIDPQHGCHGETYDNGSGYIESCPSTAKDGETAIEFASRKTMLPPQGVTIVTLRPDVDSVGAMAVLHLLVQGIDITSAKGRIDLIAQVDSFGHSGWPGRQPLPTKEQPWNEGVCAADGCRPLSAIAAAVSDHRILLAERVATMEKWLLTGEEPMEYRAKVENERMSMVEAIVNGEIAISTTAKGVAVVESTHRAALGLGYTQAPVVVACNPALRLGGGKSNKKITICQFEEGYIDLPAILTELNACESGWGGSKTIGGSPQGVSTTLTIDEIVEVVERHLL